MMHLTLFTGVRQNLPVIAILGLTGMIAACESGSAEFSSELSSQLLEQLNSLYGSSNELRMPESHDLASIPQDPNNPLTPAKVALGKLLYHETGVGTVTPALDRRETYSCASCHHAAAGFKSNLAQGIADGGVGFARQGRDRMLAEFQDPGLPDNDPNKPDVQPIASPTTLNVAYQSLVLWNGSFGNASGDPNGEVDPDRVDAAGPAQIRANAFALSGIETQVLAGTQVHRLRFDNGSILQIHPTYQALYADAFPDSDSGYIPPGSDVTPEALGAAKAISAYERTLLANRAPFQRWLSGDRDALSNRQLRGALLFFGKAGCSDCHTGPALSTDLQASSAEMFRAVGFADLDATHGRMSGSITEAERLGRGGFTGFPQDDFRFKVPTLYNLADTGFLGHGATFRTVREVVEYKNEGIPQKDGVANLELTPLGLSSDEVAQLTEFVEHGLYDPALERYIPDSLPSGNCFPVADLESKLDLGCN